MRGVNRAVDKTAARRFDYMQICDMPMAIINVKRWLEAPSSHVYLPPARAETLIERLRLVLQFLFLLVSPVNKYADKRGQRADD